MFNKQCHATYQKFEQQFTFHRHAIRPVLAGTVPV